TAGRHAACLPSWPWCCARRLAARAPAPNRGIHPGAAREPRAVGMGAGIARPGADRGAVDPACAAAGRMLATGARVVSPGTDGALRPVVVRRWRSVLHRGLSVGDVVP